MAVFGIPVLHEDDALRAVRAAAEMVDAVPELGLQARAGLNSGEVVTGTEERLATGDAVNVAARLQQAAQPGETLLGETTLRLARDAVEAEPVEPLPLKGKREPVPAWRLVAVSTAAVERRFDSPLVGRERELAALAEAWERARGGPGCELVTVVGSAGVGKSRLAAEFLAGAEVTVIRGRWLSSSTSRFCRRARRSCSYAWAGRSCSTGGAAGAASYASSPSAPTRRTR